MLAGRASQVEVAEMDRGRRPSAPHGHLDGLVIVADDPHRRGLRGRLRTGTLPQLPPILGAAEPEPPQLASAAIGAIPMGREDDEGIASAPTKRDPIGSRPPTHLERIQQHDGWPAVGQQRLRDDVGELVDVIGRERRVAAGPPLFVDVDPDHPQRVRARRTARFAEGQSSPHGDERPRRLAGGVDEATGRLDPLTLTERPIAVMAAAAAGVAGGRPPARQVGPDDMPLPVHARGWYAGEPRPLECSAAIGVAAIEPNATAPVPEGAIGAVDVTAKRSWHLSGVLLTPRDCPSTVPTPVSLGS